ncbi:C45 family peptidase [Vibrio mediterranei]|uniref:C45 family autoproteolytic acyltransferase/hydolase n=1 Tax=Vibrio mediterranei TaxID=689 RepID=UPI001EFE5614|nr:C45 family peptidase [Vibrio mediterranei]MCG9628114.1 C45 family peptidase [Vibrio mediterranei]
MQLLSTKSLINIAVGACLLSSVAHAASLEAVEGLNVNQPYYTPEKFVQQEHAPVVNLTGIAPEEHGKAIMAIAGQEVRQFLINAKRKFEIIGLDSAELAKQLKVTYKNSKALNPDYMVTLESLAKELDVDAHELFALTQTDYAVVQLLNKGVKTDAKAAGCTSMAFNLSGVVGQTNDLASLDGGTGILLKKDDTIVAMTGFGPAGQTLGKNVGVVINFLGADTDGVDLDSGMATGMGVLVEQAAKSENVDEALELLKKHRTIVGMNFTMADIYGGAVSVEMSKGGLLVTRGDKGVAHANHSLRENSEKDFRAKLGGTFREQTIQSAYSFWRQDVADTFLKHTPETSVEAMQYIFSQKPIAQTAAYGSDFITVSTVVMDTKAGCIHFAPGVSEWNSYQQVCFD